MKQREVNLAILAGFFLLFTQNEILAQTFKVIGTMTLQRFTGTKTTRTQHFEVTSTGCRALILSSNTDNGAAFLKMIGGKFSNTNASDRLSVETAFDDPVSYRLTRFFHDGRATLAPEINSFASFDVPADSSDGINYLWFAYASSGYFRGQTNQLLEPLWTLDDAELKRQRFKVKADWKLSAEPPYLPLQASYYSDGLLRMRSNNKAFSIPAPHPYEHGFTNFTYKEMASSNFNGIMIPTEFQFVRYGFVRSNLQVIYLVSGKVNQIVANVTNSTFRPAYEGEIRILDKRYGSSNPPINDLFFPARSNSWTATNAEKLYQQQVKVKERMDSGE